MTLFPTIHGIRKIPLLAMQWAMPLIVFIASSTLPGNSIASSIYTYDLVGRVSTVLYDNGTCVAYLYDANGNRNSQTNTLSGGPLSPVWGTGVWGCFPWTP
jgi:YD repeat-containing protein